MQFTSLVAEIQEAHEDNYTAAGFAALDDAEAWISFMTKPDDSLLELMRTLPIDVEVRWGLPATHDELSRLNDSVSAAAGEVGGGALRFYSSVSPDGRAIDLTYAFESVQSGSQPAVVTRELVASELAAVLEPAAGSFRDAKLPVPVRVHHEPGLRLDGAAEVFGGGTMRLASNADPECAAGFTGRRDGAGGIITARHCADELRFGNNVGWIKFVTVAGETPNGNSIDLQWHQAINGTTSPPKFRSTSQHDYRTTQGRSDPLSGSITCKWGLTTEYTCSIVESANTCYKPAGLVYCGIFTTERRSSPFSLPGDSGGPVFFSNTAQGFVSGYATNANQTIWVGLNTRVSMSSTYMDAPVKTS